jgi:hypothetical protein
VLPRARSFHSPYFQLATAASPLICSKQALWTFDTGHLQLSGTATAHSLLTARPLMRSTLKKRLRAAGIHGTPFQTNCCNQHTMPGANFLCAMGCAQCAQPNWPRRASGCNSSNKSSLLEMHHCCVSHNRLSWFGQSLSNEIRTPVYFNPSAPWFCTLSDKPLDSC